MSHSQDYREGDAPGSKQRSESNGGSKVTSERAALLVLSALLAAAVIVICRLSFDNMQTKKHFQTLRDEHEAVKKNLTDDSCMKCEEGWEQHGERCYYFSTDKLNWTKSRDECRQRKGQLVKIDSREEQTFLEQTMRNKMNDPEDKFWIGLTDSETEGTWKWADGSLLDTSLTFWSDDEPDNWIGEDCDGEHCVRIGEKKEDRILKSWFDKSCKVPHRRVCEKQKSFGSTCM